MSTLEYLTHKSRLVSRRTRPHDDENFQNLLVHCRIFASVGLSAKDLCMCNSEFTEFVLRSDPLLIGNPIHHS